MLGRDFEWLLSNRDPRYATPTPAALDAATAAGFRKVWEPLLKQGPIEVDVFGDIDTAATIEAINRTFGALPPRLPIPADALARGLSFPAPTAQPVVLHHTGDPDQAAAVVAWPTGGSSARLPESRKIELLGEVFQNRLLDAMREKAGASYSPQVQPTWPLDMNSGGRFMAMTQLPPQLVPEFFAAADKIAADLAATGPTADELARATEPLAPVAQPARNRAHFLAQPARRRDDRSQPGQDVAVDNERLHQIDPRRDACPGCQVPATRQGIPHRSPARKRREVGSIRYQM